jgi:3-oxoacyl-(acyl-carrier-protein) synthase
VRSARWGGLSVRPNRYPLPHQAASSRIMSQALAESGVAPHDVAVAYLSGSGDPPHDTAELALLASTFKTISPLVTSITHLVGEYGGLGALRVAAATVTVHHGILSTLTYLHQPIRSDIRFATSEKSPLAPGVVLVHGLARGGMQTALILGPPQAQGMVC